MITIDPHLPIPPYEQLKEQIIAARATVNSTLPEPASDAPVRRLPPVRRLALELGIAPGTVARAYKDLEHSGIVATHGRRGTFMTPPGTTDSTTSTSPAALVEQFVAAARRTGLTPEQTLDLVAAALRHR
ncbi:MAG: GntR family transcriptional regulator [Arcanobacterium sp.]|nr:GntR family transcriptional regulator [Arcanobacterium sp.]MDY5588637.1 GntR family transcriptional regulator [Arcanobacterium sp.]